MRSFACALAAILVPALAAAQPAPPPPPTPSPIEEARPERDASITISPAHLIPIRRGVSGGRTMSVLMLEVMGELRLRPRIGVAGILALGRIDVDDTSGDTDFLAWEAGGQVNGYLVGDFSSRHGFHVGAEVLYVRIEGELDGTTGFANGLSIAPYGGYKFVADGGFTFVAQLGVAYLALRAEVEGSTEEDSQIGPLLNLNLGWSL